MEMIKNEYSASGFIFLPENTLLLNVETTGLRPSSSFVCMVSAGYRNGNNLYSITWLAGSRRDESAILHQIQELAVSFRTISTFGGNSFAFRFLKDRFAIYSDEALFPDINKIDLQKTYHPLLKILPLERLKKEDVECFLGFHRRGVKTGKELITFYQSWEREKSADTKDALLLHAQEDIRFLCEVYKLHAYLDFLQGKWEAVSVEETADGILFDVRLISNPPKQTAWSNAYARICVNNQFAQILVTPFCGRLRYFLPGPCSEYYYLPAEDTAIHCSVAQFVDRTQRRKATPETCYVNRNGIFLPVPDKFPAPVFHVSYKSEPAYTQFENEKWQQDISLAEKYLAAILSV